MKSKEWRVIEIFYNNIDQVKADKQGKSLRDRGFELNDSDKSDDQEYEYCDQYIKAL